jgi:transposase
MIHHAKVALDEILCLSARFLNGPLLVSFLYNLRRQLQWRKKLMTTAATHKANGNTTEAALFVAFELSERTWKLGFTTGHGQKPRERSVTARDQERVLEDIAQAKHRLGLPETAPVVSCYEAGREGFWLHRFLEAHGIINPVVDSSAIEVSRRQRRAKSDGLDVRKLLSMLIRYEQGEKKVWQVVKVPSVEAEDQRHLHRDLETLKRERASTTTRIQGLLRSQGIRLTSLNQLPEQLDALRLWDGAPMPPGLRQRVLRVYAHHQFLSEQIAEVEAERRAQLQASSEASIEQIRQLMVLKGIGINGAWLLVMEFFGWREFKNRREVGGLAGFTPTPYQSGDSTREQGITKSGNRHVRWMVTELAWSGLRFQPESALSVWFRERFGGGGKRLRRIGIVAVARKLLIALWRFLETGVLPEGAVLKEG